MRWKTYFILIILIMALCCPQVCAVAKPWDVEVVFEKADHGNFYPFQNIPGRTGETYGVSLEDADDDDLILFTEYCDGEGEWWVKASDRCTPQSCSNASSASCRCSDTSTVYRLNGWFVERKRISQNSYNVLIRGVSQPDCGKTQSYVMGKLRVNPGNEWELTNLTQCNVGDDKNGRETFCRLENGILRFASGTTCGGCCACADGGRLNINVTVSKTSSPPELLPDSLMNLKVILIVVVLLAGILALLFGIQRIRSHSKKQCPTCKRKISGKGGFCEFCGGKLNP